MAASDTNVSLRANFAATFVGNAVFAAGQWAILSLIAKLGDTRMLGEYALAVAVATPVAMFSHLNLRTVLVTDVARRHSFGDYLSVRIGTILVGLAVTAAIAVGSGYAWPQAATIVLIGLVLSLDNLSDIFYGLLQRRERMDRIAWSMIARGLLSPAALGLTVAFTRNLPAAVAAMAAVRVAVLLAYDVPAGTRGETLTFTGPRAQFSIFRMALPLGAVLLLISLTSNLPRYVIERTFGAVDLGVFTAVVSFLTVGSTIMNALGQAATPRLARYSSARDPRPFRALALKLTLAGLLLGLAGVAAALVLGRFVLGLLYRPEYAAHSSLLVWVMAAAALSYIAIALGFVITSVRAFTAQVPLLGMVAGMSGAASWMLVPRLGLNGAVWALAAAWSIQIAGELLILGRTLRHRESRA